MLVSKINWIKYEGIADGDEVFTKIGIRIRVASVIYTMLMMALMRFYEHVKIAPGQKRCFCEGDEVIGGGIIQQGALL